MHGPYLKQPQPPPILNCTTCEQPSIDGRQKHRTELSCHTCFNFSHLCSRLPTLHSDTVSLVPRLSPQRRPPIDLHEMFNCAYLKFTVSGLSKQASIDAHTVCNVVTLVWGLLRFSPIMNSLHLFFTCVLIGPKHHLV